MDRNINICESEKVYLALEKKITRYSDLVNISTKDNKEKLVIISNPDISINQIDSEMKCITGDAIYVRKKVFELIEQAAQELKNVDNEYQLEVVYGYRSLGIQQKLFKEFKKQFEDKYSGVELIEATHRLVASPDVAGHPTGGAIDVQILQNGKPIDMGTKIWTFSKDSYVFSPFVSEQAKTNRKLLRKIMLSVGFAPFDGEWWHYSYGDKEWAYYYKKPFAIYDQVEFSVYN